MLTFLNKECSSMCTPQDGFADVFFDPGSQLFESLWLWYLLNGPNLLQSEHSDLLNQWSLESLEGFKWISTSKDLNQNESHWKAQHRGHLPAIYIFAVIFNSAWFLANSCMYMTLIFILRYESQQLNSISLNSCY